MEVRGHVPFHQYVSTKLGKFGVKVYWVTKAELDFLLHCLMYTEQQRLSQEEIDEHDSRVIVLIIKLLSPFLNCGKNLTGGTYITDRYTANLLLQHNTTYVVTARNNKQCLSVTAKIVANWQGRFQTFPHQ